MFEGFLGAIGALAGNKKVVGAWLILLTTSVGAIGDKVYVQRTAELAVIETQMDVIQKSLNEIKEKLDQNGAKLDTILADTNKLRGEFDEHKRTTQ